MAKLLRLQICKQSSADLSMYAIGTQCETEGLYGGASARGMTKLLLVNQCLPSLKMHQGSTAVTLDFEPLKKPVHAV